MSRPLRIEYEQAVYHVTARGNERWAIFRDDQDRQCLLDTRVPLMAVAVLALAAVLAATTQAADTMPAAGREMPATMRAALAMGVGKARLSAMSSAAQAWAAQKPAAAFDWAFAQSNADKLQFLMLDVVERQWVADDTNAAADYVQKLPESTAKGLAMHFLWLDWAHRDPAAATTMAGKQPAERWGTVFSSVAEGYAGTDPAKAAEWALALPPDQAKHTYAILASTWVWKDQPAAAAFVAKLPDCPARNEAAARVARNWSRRHPDQVEQVRNWVKGLSIPDAERTKILAQLGADASTKPLP